MISHNSRALIEQWHLNNKIIGIANGCFDILHAGHVLLFEESKKYCDKLIVALDSDESVKQLKGENRPYNNLTERQIVVNSIRHVDLVVSFHTDQLLDLLKSIEPHYIFKGEDYKAENVVGYGHCDTWGGRVIILPPFGISTRSSKLWSKL